MKIRRIWAGLVSYANGATTKPGEIRRIIADCMPWVAAVEPFGLLDPIWPDENLLRQAAEYRPSIDALLRWLCSAKSEERDKLDGQVLSFLREHTQHIGGMRLKEVFYNPADVEKLNYTPAELEHLKEVHDRYWADWKNSPLGILTPSKEYYDIADPICDFVLSEYQKSRNREQSRKDKKPVPVVPIFVCPNPACKKLVMPERTGRKKYCSDCSDHARAEKYRKKASPNENRDYQWLYRLKHTESTLRKVRLRDPKVRGRLKEIKASQPHSSRCQNLIQDMRL
jgi:hypothetical protein